MDMENRDQVSKRGYYFCTQDYIYIYIILTEGPGVARGKKIRITF